LWLMQLAVFREEAWTIWTPRIHFSFFSPAGVFLLPVSRCDFDGLDGCDHRWRVVGSPRIFPLEGLLTSAGWDSVGMGLVQVWIEYRPHADISRSGISYEEKVL